MNIANALRSVRLCECVPRYRRLSDALSLNEEFGRATYNRTKYDALMGKFSAMHFSLALSLLALFSWPTVVLSASDIYYCASVNTGASNAASKRFIAAMCMWSSLTVVQIAVLFNRTVFV